MEFCKNRTVVRPFEIVAQIQNQGLTTNIKEVAFD